MTMNRSKIFALCIGVALLLMAGTAMAGTTSITALRYARELGAANVTYTIPAGYSTVKRALSVIRAVGQDFFVDVSLDGGALFLTSPGTFGPADGAGAGGVAAITQITSIGSGKATVRYLFHITTDFTNLATFTLTMTGATVQDVTNVLGGGGTINMTLATFDAATNASFDVGTDQRGFLIGAFGVNVSPTLAASSAIIDVAANRLKFTGNSTVDNGASFGIVIGQDSSGRTIYNQAGTGAYALSSVSSVQLVFTAATGDLTGIKKIIWDPTGVNKSSSTTPFTINISGDSASFGTTFPGTAKNIEIDVDGTTTLVPRIINLQVNINLGGGTDGPVGTRTLFGPSLMTQWTLNGTVLTADWINGNNAAFNGRVYLWNPSSIGGAVTAQIYTLPVGMGGSSLLGTVNLGTLGATSATNVRVAEDLLTPAGIALPYTTNGGNLLIVFTINATGCQGASNVFSGAFSFGVLPLWK